MGTKIFTYRVYDEALIRDDPESADTGSYEAWYSLEAAKSAAREDMLNAFREALKDELEQAADQINESKVRSLRTKINGDFKPKWTKVPNTVGPVEEYTYYFGHSNTLYTVYSLIVSR